MPQPGQRGFKVRLTAKTKGLSDALKDLIGHATGCKQQGGGGDSTNDTVELLTYGLALVASSVQTNEAIAAAMQKLHQIKKDQDQDQDQDVLWATTMAERITNELYAGVGVLLQIELESPASNFKPERVATRLKSRYKKDTAVPRAPPTMLLDGTEVAEESRDTAVERRTRGESTIASTTDIDMEVTSPYLRPKRSVKVTDANEASTAVGSGTTNQNVRKPPKKKAKISRSGEDGLPEVSKVVTVLALHPYTVTVQLKGGKTITVPYFGGGVADDEGEHIMNAIWANKNLATQFRSLHFKAQVCEVKKSEASEHDADESTEKNTEGSHRGVGFAEKDSTRKSSEEACAAGAPGGMLPTPTHSSAHPDTGQAAVEPPGDDVREKVTSWFESSKGMSDTDKLTSLLATIKALTSQ